MLRKILKLIFIITILAIFLTISGITLTQASQGQGIPQLIAQLKSDILNLAEKLESDYEELKSLISDSEEKISELNERVETLEAKVAYLESLHPLSIKLFDPTPCTQSPGFPGVIPEWTFKKTTVEVEMRESDKAVISSTPDGTGNYVHDNDLYINGVYAGPGFSAFYGPVGVPAEIAWGTVPPKDVTSFIPIGKTDVTFELRDHGGWYGNTAIYLTIFRNSN